MHTLHRLFVLCLVACVAVPSGTLALITFNDRDNAEASLHQAIDVAAKRYRSRLSLQVQKSGSEKKAEQQAKEIALLQRRKNIVREEIAAVRSTLTRINARYELSLAKPEEAKVLYERGMQQLSALAKSGYLQQIASAGIADTAPVNAWVRLLAREPALGDGGDLALLPAYADFLRDMRLAEGALTRLTMLHDAHAKLIAEHRTAQAQYDKAESALVVSSAQIEEIKAIMSDVHAQVLRLQGELARIEARLKSKAERALLEKGLIDPEDLARKATSVQRPAFNWPAYGPVSAGFHQASYRAYFGVPHEGMDIVIPEATPVYSAADGIVFLVRDGGEKGYTYVLIGHRNGYATLYGHLLSVSVTAGQEIAGGQMIGLSGGRPGTPGAGPMTTAPHLHFEMIQAGVNVDPKAILP